MLDNSFISVAVYYWLEGYIRSLYVNCFCQVNIVNNLKEMAGNLFAFFQSEVFLRKKETHSTQAT